MNNEADVVMRLGLDAKGFEEKLAAQKRLADKYANTAGSQFNVGPQNGGMPNSWGSMANLSQQSQNLLKQGKGISDIVASLKTAHPAIGNLLNGIGALGSKFAGLGGILAPVAYGFQTVTSRMKEAWELAQDAEILQVSSMFMLTLGKAARSAGDDIASATGKLLRFEGLIGAAQAGAKDATDTLKELGVAPWGKSMEDAISAVADAFGKIEDPAKKADLANKAFGKGGMQTLDMLEKLAEKQAKAKFGILEQRDLDTLDAGYKKLRAFTSGITGAASDYARVWAATMLRWTGLVKSAPEKAVPTIGAPEQSPEQRAKLAKETEEARQKYLQARRESYDKGTQLAYALAAQADWERKIKELANGTKEKYEAQTKALEEGRKVKELTRDLQDAQNRKLETQLDMEKRIRTEHAAYAKGVQDLATARSDRSGWQNKELAGLGSKDFQKAQSAMENYLGRRLTGKEFSEAQGNWKQATNLATGAEKAGEAAHWFKMLLPGYSGSATSAEEMLRGANKALTSGEQQPFAQQLQHLGDIKNNIADLNKTAHEKGILIRPINGK